MSDNGTINAIEDLARRVHATAPVEFGPADGAVPLGVSVRAVRSDERLETVDLERMAPTPRQARGHAVLHDGPSFAAYVTRLYMDSTTLWARPPAPSDVVGTRGTPGRVVAVFNDHFTGAAPGWRDHRATLAVRTDPDWAAWTALDGRLIDQKPFAQFLLDHQHNIADPSPAKLMPAVLQFSAARNAQYESGVNLDNGEIRMSYVEEVKQNSRGKQTVALPQTITLGLYPFAGAVEASEPWPVEARIRHQIPHDGGPLQIGFKLTRPDWIVQQAWDQLCAQLRDNIPDTVPVLQGEAPEALR